MSRPTTSLLIPVTLLAMALSANVQAWSGGAVDAAGSAVVFADAVNASPNQSNCTSLSEAVERVRRQYGGRIISAETVRSGKREVHVIKVLTDDNKVKTVRVNGC